MYCGVAYCVVLSGGQVLAHIWKHVTCNRALNIKIIRDSISTIGHVQKCQANLMPLPTQQ